MQKEHTDSIRRNFVKLVRETPVDLVVDRLFQDKILTDEQREEILINANSYLKAKNLIAMLRGPHAFEGFCNALVAEGKEDLVHLLRGSKNDAKEVVQSNERSMIEIGDNVFLVVNEWENEVLIHIRRYEKNSANKNFPTKKGIALRMSQWQYLEMYADEIDEAIGRMVSDNEASEIAFHLGRGVYATVNKAYPTVDVRQRWIPPESTEVVPTKKGISLTYEKWEALKEAFPDIKAVVPEFEDNVPCILREDHQNQEGMLSCSSCNPFGEPF